jgi:Flp pilus assembly protein TadG
MMPILMTMLVSIFYVGWSFNNNIMLTQAVGAGASYLQALAQNTATQLADPCAATTTVIQNAAPNLNTSNLTISYTLNGTPYGASCNGGSSNFVLGANLTVTASYPCSMAPLSGLANLITSGTAFSSSCRIQAQATELIY